ncbi:GNAT family N-acetyltransferase [Mycobacterium sp. MS1601]|uniref:GNAT family N-acetyltransferase n=1 Tax=Mycobacterium sp. MS1601 TaxID=1936029 RepID=UPI0009798086|nr:GNAT family N-acetyltransferase [Mycobacterium sp. MS1601]AQA01876.1 GNAT family N-acetyltransferase [Mycobacterium sp. MS1601]
MTLTDKTGTPLTVAKEPGKFVVTVDGQAVGLAAFRDNDGQRVFFHTEVDDSFGGRGIATVLVQQALSATRSESLRIVAVCPLVSAYVKKNHEFDDIVDRPTREILHWLQA